MNLDEYTFDTLTSTAVVEHFVPGCGWRYRCDGDSVDRLLVEIEHHHNSVHAPAAGSEAD